MSALIGRLKDFVRLDQADQQRNQPESLACGDGRYAAPSDTRTHCC